MELQRANWLEKKLARFTVTAIVRAIKFGMPSQMPWTDLPLGLSRACSTEAEPHRCPQRRTSLTHRHTTPQLGFKDMAMCRSWPALHLFARLPSIFLDV